MNVLKHRSFNATKDGEQIRIEQYDDRGEINTVVLHIDQLTHVARHAGILFGDPDLGRKLSVLAERVVNFASTPSIRKSILYGNDAAESTLAQLDAIADLAIEFDVGLEPDENLSSQPPNDQAGRLSSALVSAIGRISVTADQLCGLYHDNAKDPDVVAAHQLREEIKLIQELINLNDHPPDESQAQMVNGSTPATSCNQQDLPL